MKEAPGQIKLFLKCTTAVCDLTRPKKSKGPKGHHPFKGEDREGQSNISGRKRSKEMGSRSLSPSSKGFERNLVRKERDGRAARIQPSPSSLLQNTYTRTTS